MSRRGEEAVGYAETGGGAVGHVETAGRMVHRLTALTLGINLPVGARRRPRSGARRKPTRRAQRRDDIPATEFEVEIGGGEGKGRVGGGGVGAQVAAYWPHAAGSGPGWRAEGRTGGAAATVMWDWGGRYDTEGVCAAVAEVGAEAEGEGGGRGSAPPSRRAPLPTAKNRHASPPSSHLPNIAAPAPTIVTAAHRSPLRPLAAIWNFFLHRLSDDYLPPPPQPTSPIRSPVAVPRPLKSPRTPSQPASLPPPPSLRYQYRHASPVSSDKLLRRPPPRPPPQPLPIWSHAVVPPPPKASPLPE
uniref:Uncharacterized protein n=1 Tax=Oryza nivara TaxID=4536 RepID=A0A0E0HJV1_ORYNI